MVNEQIEQAQQQLSSQIQQQEQARASVQEARNRLQSQQSLRQLSLQQRQQAERQLQSFEQQLQSRDVQLQQAQQQISQVQQALAANIAAQQSRVQEIASVRTDIDLARKAFEKKEPGILSTGRQREFFRQLAQGQDSDLIIARVEEQLGQSIPLSSRESIIQQFRAEQEQIIIPPLPSVQTQQELEQLQTIAPLEDLPGAITTRTPQSEIQELLRQRDIALERAREMGGFRGFLGQLVIGAGEIGLISAQAVPDTLRFLGAASVGLASAVVSPIETGRGIVTQAKEEPIVFAGTVIALEPGGRLISAVLPDVGDLAKIGFIDVPLRRFRKVTDLEGKQSIVEIPSELAGRTTIDIEVLNKLPRISLPEQAALAGQQLDLVSGQRGIFGIFSPEKTIRKPIPGEELLSVDTKALLAQFDAGTLPRSRIPELNRRIIEESKAKGLLERAFFADPFARARPSRLGLVDTQQPATLGDILRRNVQLRRDQPQLLLLEGANIPDFPPFLRDVGLALKEGRQLTQSQRDRLLKWQLTGEGFRPIGFVGKEAEIVAPPGQLLVKQGLAATTLIAGRRVPIIRATVTSATPETQILLGKLKRQDITQPEMNRLLGRLEAETGFSRRELSSALGTSRPFLSVSPGVSRLLDVSTGVSQPQIISSPLSMRYTILSGAPSISQPISPLSIISLPPSLPPSVPPSLISPPPSPPPISQPSLISPPPSPPPVSPPSIISPPPSPPVSPPPIRRMIREAQRIRDSQGEFEAFGRRFKKDFSLGKSETQQQAERLLSDFTKKTLGG